MANEESRQPFSGREWLRYTRHIQLPEVGAAGQLKLKQARVLIIGLGGLGAPVSQYLTAAGIGRLTLVDGDSVDLSNLQRQVVFSTDQVGQNKAVCAAQRLSGLNPDITIAPVSENLSEDNARGLVDAADLVIDCTDNFATRYLINDYCALLGKPWVFASIHTFSGQCALFTPETACFRCLFPAPPAAVADCNSAGVIGALPGLLGALQASEALKYLLDLPVPLKNNLLLVNAADLSFRAIKLARDPNCPCCGNVAQLVADTDYLPPVCSAENDSAETDRLAAAQFEQLRRKESVQVLDVRGAAERAAFSLGGLHIPLDELPVRVNELDKSKTILCYCQSGIRSGKAATLLRSQGFENAFSIRGGLVAILAAPAVQD